MITFPVDFENKAKSAKSAGGGGYPTQISAGDLMRDFAMAALDADETLIETVRIGAYESRKLKIPAVPQDGEKILSSTSGNLSWKTDIPSGEFDGQLLQWSASLGEWVLTATPTSTGQLLQWSSSLNKWILTAAPTTKDDILRWSTVQGKWNVLSPPATGTQVLSSDNGDLSWKTDIPIGASNGQLLEWSASLGEWVLTTAPTVVGQLLRWSGSTWTPVEVLPATPGSGTYVLGAVSGTLTWIATEECP